MNQKLLEFKEINLVSKPLDDVLGFYNCCFCGKKVEENEISKQNKALSGDSFYCSFCLRMGWNTKNNRNCLIVSFRPIIGYYYYAFYLNKSRTMWMSNIKTFLNAHVKAGIVYPFLSYDEDSMFWFMDFRKIGKKKVGVEEACAAMLKISSCFNLKKHIPKFKTEHFNKKITDSINNFYENRPSAEQIVMLDLVGCGEFDRSIDFNSLKTFSNKNLTKNS